MVYKMEELNWKELDALDRNQTVFFIPVSPLEEHGPHLPVGVDYFHAESFSNEVAKSFCTSHPSWHAVIVPPLAVGVDVIDFVGSIRIRQRVLRDLMVDYGSSLARHGFKYIVVVSAHGGPGHIVALEEAAEMVSRRYRVKMISPTGRIAVRFLLGEYVDSCNAHLPKPLTPEEISELKKDYHAGCWETSIMLKIRPDLVKQDYHKLEPRFRQPWEIMMDSVTASGPDAGYLGIPSRASHVIAEASTRVLTQEVLGIVERLVSGDALVKERYSPFFHVPFYKTDFWGNFALWAGTVASLCGLVMMWRALPPADI
ncbi:MAG: creatininase family protein [Candidatus Xenobia bacterium]